MKDSLYTEKKFIYNLNINAMCGGINPANQPGLSSNNFDNLVTQN